MQDINSWRQDLNARGALGRVQGAEQEDDQQAKQLDTLLATFWSPSPAGTSARHGDQGETSFILEEANIGEINDSGKQERERRDAGKKASQAMKQKA